MITSAAMVREDADREEIFLSSTVYIDFNSVDALCLVLAQAQADIVKYKIPPMADVKEVGQE